MSVDPQLSKLASQVYRQNDMLAKTANAGAPLPLVAAQVDLLIRTAQALAQAINETPYDPATTISVDMVIPEAFQAMHSDLFGDHKEGTLPDTFPDEWREE